MLIKPLTRMDCIARMPFLLALTADQTDWPPWTDKQFLKDLPEKWRLSLVLDVGGCAILSRRGPKHVHLHLLAIKPSERSKGFGSELMIEIIRNHGDGLITLKVPSNPKTIAFYKRHGFHFTVSLWQRWLAKWQPMARDSKAITAASQLRL